MDTPNISKFKLDTKKQLKPEVVKDNKPKMLVEERIVMINFRAPATMQRRIKEALLTDEHYGTTQNEFLIEAVEKYLNK